MIRSIIIGLTALTVLAGAADAATQCKDPKTKRFIKCTPAATATVAPTAGVTKDAKGRCHVAAGPKKGQFTKC